MTDEPKIYYCPTAGEVEQHPGGGFDVCCDHPELHRAIKWTDLWGIDPNYLKDADEGCTGEGRGRGHTYTASEVKVLTETAGEAGRRIGWKAAGEEIAAAIMAHRDADDSTREFRLGLSLGAKFARDIASQPSQATSDATSGVPGHPEVSEAVRSPQEPRGSHWNYRLTVRTESDDNAAWEVREIYYNDAGEVSLWSKDAVAALGDSWEECAADLSRMAEASDHAAFDLDAKRWVDHLRRPKDPS